MTLIDPKTRNLCCEKQLFERAINYSFSAATLPFKNTYLVCYHVEMNRAIIQLSPDIFQQLHELCKSPTACVYRNARVILLASDGMPVIDIALALGVSARSVKSAMRGFNVRGLDALTSRGYVGRPSELTPIDGRKLSTCSCTTHMVG